MTITGDWQVEVSESLLIGAGTSYVLTAPGIRGLDLPEPRTSDLRRGSYPGDVANADVPARRVLQVPIEILGDDPVDALELWTDLKAVWSARESDTTLDLRYPGGTTHRFYGRPRSLSGDLSSLGAGNIGALATFVALDPFGYGPAELVTDSSSPAAVTSSGDVPTDRFTITIGGSGGTPVLTSTTDDTKSIAFSTALGGSSTAVLDFRARIVLVDGDDAYDRLAPAPEWFRLLPGANSISFTGCTGIEISHRPAYL